MSKQNLHQANKVLIVKLIFDQKAVNITAASERIIVIQGTKYSVLGAILCKKSKDDSVQFSAIVRQQKTFYLLTDLQRIVCQWPRG